MGASQIPAASTASNPSDNWVLISSTNPVATSLNVTGISGYKKLRVQWNTASVQSLASFRLNADSGANYSYNGYKLVGVSTTPVIVASQYASAPATTLVPTDQHSYFDLVIESADTANMKMTKLDAMNSTPHWITSSGYYRATAAVSQINITWGALFNDLVKVYGVLA